MVSLILASGSRYRIARLENAGLQFRAFNANVDETAFEDEDGKTLAERLAYAKAHKIAKTECRDLASIVIGCDQVAELSTGSGIKLLGKPQNSQNAKSQLLLCSGNEVLFHTSLHLLNTETGTKSTRTERVSVKFKILTEELIDRYLTIDEPYDCAGSFKMEKAGIFLFDRIDARDPNALLGIPMIALVESLADLGYDIFDFMK